MQHPFGVLPDSTGLHEGEAALHEEDDDGHDEEEEVVDLFRNLLFRTFFGAPAAVVLVVDGGVGKRLVLEQGWGVERCRTEQCRKISLPD